MQLSQLQKVIQQQQPCIRQHESMHSIQSRAHMPMHCKQLQDQPDLQQPALAVKHDNAELQPASTAARLPLLLTEPLLTQAPQQLQSVIVLKGLMRVQGFVVNSIMHSMLLCLNAVSAQHKRSLQQLNLDDATTFHHHARKCP